METNLLIWIIISVVLLCALTTVLILFFYKDKTHKKELKQQWLNFKNSQEFQDLLAKNQQLQLIQNELEIQRLKFENQEQQNQQNMLMAINVFKQSREYVESLEEAKRNALLQFKSGPEFLRLLSEQTQHQYCGQKLSKALFDQKENFKKEMVQKDEEYRQLQEKFNFERRYKNVSNIGAQLKDAIVNRLVESFSVSKLINVDSNPPIQKVQSKKQKSVKTDILVDIYSPFSPHTRILRVIIEAKNQKPDTLVAQKNRNHFEQLFEQLEAYEADFGLLVTELEPENHSLTISPIENRDDAFVMRFGYLVGFLQILIRLSLKEHFYNQNIQKIKPKEELIKVIDLGTQEIKEKQFRYIVERNKQIRDKCENIKGILDDIDELTQKNDRRLRMSSNKLLNFYSQVKEEIKPPLLEERQNRLPQLENPKEISSAEEENLSHKQEEDLQTQN